MNESPFVMSSVDQLKILPLLAHGANAVVYKCVELFEADPLGASVQDILDYTGVSRPTAKKTLRFLETSGLIRYTPEGRYRINDLASYRGPSRHDLRSILPSDASAPSLLPKSPAQKSFSSPQKVFPIIDISTVPTPVPENYQYSIINADTKNLFSAVGVGGSNLLALARTVAPALAEEWALWVEHADHRPHDNPQGILVASLSRDPTTPPPATADQLRRWRERRTLAPALAENRTNWSESPVDTAATKLWRAALRELQLQMTKATFDTWVKSTTAVALEDGTLIVAVRNVYAKQWLEHRLFGIVQRTLERLLGHAISVTFTVPES